ncbi:fatty acid--[acyl-carrier-protein] ligase ScoC-like [Crassostrea virginica]
MEASYLASSTAPAVPYTTYPELLRKWASKTTNKAAFIFVDKDLKRTVLSYSDLYENSTKFAKGLVHYGVKQGDIIGLSGRNVPEWLIANFGIQMAGGCPLYFSFHKKDGNDIVTLFQGVGKVKLLIFDPGVEEQNCAIVSRIVEKMSADGELNSSSSNKLERIISFYKNAHPSFNQSISDFYAIDVDVELPRLDPEDLAAIFLTSGSMGIPKAVPHSHHAILTICHHFHKSLSLQSEDGILYNDRKFSWGAGYPLLDPEIFGGGTRVVATDALTSSSLFALTEVVAEIIKREKVTHAVLIQPVIDILMKEKIAIKLKKIIILGTVGFRSVLDCVGKICDELVNMYGMTEFGAIAAGSYRVDDVKTYKHKVLSVKPLPGVELKVTDDNGHMVPVGDRGLIQVRSQKRFTGYLNHKNKWIDQLVRTGWLNSLDGGYITTDGSIIIEGRINGVMEVYGSKAYPFQVENALKGMKAISNAVVIPIREKETKFCVPCAAVVYHPGSEDTTQNIQEYFREEFAFTKENPIIASLYVPQVVVKFKTFPQTSSGKPDRHGIAAEIKRQIDPKKYECIE